MPIEITWAMALRTALNNPPDDGEEQIVKEARRLKDEHQTEFLKQFHRHEMLERKQKIEEARARALRKPKKKKRKDQGTAPRAMEALKGWLEEMKKRREQSV